MSKVPFVNYPLQYKNLKEDMDKAIEDVLSRGDLILRKDVEDFENSMASFLGVKYGIGVNSCTDGLIFALKAAGIKEGDEVKRGDKLLIYEAMKMENSLVSEKDGKVVSVNVSAGDSILQDDVLLEIE